MIGQSLGHYKIEDQLGAGGMGVVYRATDSKLDRSVAIKILSPKTLADAAARSRFRQEALALSRLNHPNICTIYDAGEEGEQAFLAMEYVEGKPLRDLTSAGALPVERILRYGVQIADALAHAHARGIVHRDLKSANVMVTPEGRIKVLDFGLARKMSWAGVDENTLSHATAAGTVVGTLHYLAPEVLRGEPADARSDVWALGVVLHEMCSGELPFRGHTGFEVSGAILKEPPTSVPSNIPPGLRTVIGRCLAKSPGERYQRAEEVRAVLETLQSGARIAGPPPTRRRALAATVAGIGAVSLAGGAFFARNWVLPARSKARIALLPFENIGGEPQESAFANGLHQDMITVINRLYPDHLAVIARTSVLRYQRGGANVAQVGRDLKVDYVVEGGVQEDHGQTRITARLIRVKDQTSLWNATYNRELGELMIVQAEIASAIAQGIERSLRPDPQVSAALARPVKADARSAYLRGDYAKAVKLDSTYAAAFTSLALDAYIGGLFGLRPPGEAFTNTLQAASRALELDPTQASPHGSLALAKIHMQWDWSEAEQLFRRALRLDPSDGDVRHLFGHFLLWAGQPEESARESRLGLEVDPFNAGNISCLGWHELCAGHEDRALEETRRALALDPNDGWGLLTLGWIYEQKGMYPEALAAQRRSEDTTIRNASLAHVFARSGDRRAAENILGDLLAQSKTKYVSAYDIAVVYSGLDDRDKTFDWLNRAYEEHAGYLAFFGGDPRFKQLRSDRRSQDLLRRMRFPNQQV
jgi:TolB-like protein/Tfp pilus assembly protein PilF/tRNA A-37 threonylcarbamoyl transferase component Bud32